MTTQQGLAGASATHLRGGLRAGGVVVAWCGLGLRHQQATLCARREGARLLAMLQMDGLHMSRSACDGLAAVALSLQQPVGVDVEAFADIIDDAALLHPSEQRGSAVAVWVRKEAVLKALGVGLVVAPHELEVGIGDHDGGAHWSRVDVGRHGAALVRTLCAPSPHIQAAVAIQQGISPSTSTSRIQVFSGFIEAFMLSFA